MRGSGLSPGGAGLALAKVGMIFVLATFVVGEWVAPAADEAAQKLRMHAMSTLIGQEMRSGLWFKDERAFINVREARTASKLNDVRIYQFDDDDRLRLARSAAQADYLGDGRWVIRHRM